jgi:hypothetical protein
LSHQVGHVPARIYAGDSRRTRGVCLNKLSGPGRVRLGTYAERFEKP